MTLATRQVHVGDCRALLRQLPDNSIDCVVTSPPYWGLRSYGTPPQVWGGDPEHKHRFGRSPRARRAQRGPNSAESSTLDSPTKDEGAKQPPPGAAGAFCSCGAWRGELGLEPDPFLYLDHLLEVMAEVWRVLRPDGTLWLNLGDSYASDGGKTEADPSDRRSERWNTYAVSRGYRGDRLANGRGDQPAILRRKTRGTRDGSHAGKHTAMAAAGPMTQPNRFRVDGFKAKDLIGIPWRAAFALQASGWWLRSDICWAKPNPMPESVTDRPTKAHEYVFLFSKSGAPLLWRHARTREWVRSKPRADFVWTNQETRLETAIEPTGWKTETFVREGATRLVWTRRNLWEAYDYFYDHLAIREPQAAPEASTPDDRARAFSRRRQTAIDPRQEAVEADALPVYRSGNLARKQREDFGGPSDRGTNQAHAIPWTDTDGMRNKRSVWTVASEPYVGAHFATFPKKLVEPCILAGCPMGGVVLDPFGGSGTVGEVAEVLGRNWLLFDLNPKYAELAQKRTAQRGLFVEVAG